ncbi:MAG: hypothetical protein IJ733_07125, partial [Lachnospiraceae bacterium]|nr:hypothetical protein [Lachnospiraceae bacterium]
FRVTLVDTDSYHFTAKGKTYRCEVGRGEYIAPELQKKMNRTMTLRNVPLPSYTRETDLFALAVHIFQLLMNGCHPFACAREINPSISNIRQMLPGGYEDSVVAPQPVENIKEGFCVFYETRPGIIPPLYAPKFETLPITIRNLFIRTFRDGYMESKKRASAIEWVNALGEAWNHITRCKKKMNHFYFNHLHKCPLCNMFAQPVELKSRPEPRPEPKTVPEIVPLNVDFPSDNAFVKQMAFLGYSQKFDEMVAAVENHNYQEVVSIADKIVTSSKNITGLENIYYVKDGTWEDRILDGRGSVFVFDWEHRGFQYMYHGSFKNGKPFGDGIYVDDECAVIGGFRDGYMNGACTVEFFQSSTYSNYAGDVIKGTYFDGWENGSFTWIHKGDKQTYFYTAAMGKRKIIEKHKKQYVWAKSDSGWFCFETEKSALKGHRHVCLCETL